MTLWNGKLSGIAMTATDPADAVEYWSGLLGGEPDGDAIALAGGTRIDVVEGGAEALGEARFEAGPELLAAAKAEGATLDGSGPATLVDPDGWPLRLLPVAAAAPLELNGPTLSHLTLNSPSPAGQRGFYERLLFRLSDQLGEIFCWLRPNPIHHSIAFAARPQANVNHIAIELPDRSSFIGAIDGVIAGGVKLEFGPGRHMVGGNLFAYFRDRYGIRWELCAELARVDPDHAPGLFSAEDRGRSVNTYGPPPPPSFLQEQGGPAPPASN